MTALKLYRKVKSLAWRRYLAQSLEEIEFEIKEHMFQENRSRIFIAGYCIELIGRELLLEKLPGIHSKQLPFKFSKEKGA